MAAGFFAPGIGGGVLALEAVGERLDARVPRTVRYLVVRALGMRHVKEKVSRQQCLGIVDRTLFRRVLEMLEGRPDPLPAILGLMPDVKADQADLRRIRAGRRTLGLLRRGRVDEC